MRYNFGGIASPGATINATLALFAPHTPQGIHLSQLNISLGGTHVFTSSMLNL